MSYCLSLKFYLLVARSRVLAGVRYYSLLSTTCFLTRYARLESRPGSAAVNVTAPGCGLRGPFADAGNLQPATCDLQPATCDLQGRGLGCASSRGPLPPPVCAAFLGKSHGLKRPCRDLAEARGAVRRGAGSRMLAPSLRRETAWSPGGSRTWRARHVPARSPGPMRGVGKSRSRVPEQGSEGLYIMPTRVAFMDSNPDDYICNLITAGLFLESALKARDRKRLSFPLPARTKPHVK